MRCFETKVDMIELRNAYRISVGELKGQDHLGDIGIKGKIMLNASQEK
jgi:hypothetical protein